MKGRESVRVGFVVLCSVFLASCSGGSGSFGPLRLGGGYDPEARAQSTERRQSTFLDLFTNNDDPNTTLEVNKYLWNASLDVLNFLPIEAADPFTGVIVTGYGVPPGGGRAYRATIYVQDPALDARALKVALATSSGPVAPETVRAVEDAILTRARQLRIRDSNL